MESINHFSSVSAGRLSNTFRLISAVAAMVLAGCISPDGKSTHSPKSGTTNSDPIPEGTCLADCYEPRVAAQFPVKKYK